MNRLTKAKLAWKYRRQLWKYRKLIRYRREVAGVVLAGAAIWLGNCAYRYAAKRRTEAAHA